MLSDLVLLLRTLGQWGTEETLFMLELSRFLRIKGTMGTPKHSSNKREGDRELFVKRAIPC